MANRRFPTATGFEPNLYLVPGLPPAEQSILEDGFFKRTDQLASDALQFLLKGSDNDMPAKLRNGWSRLLISFMRRSPERIEELVSRAKALLETYLMRIEAEAGTGDVPPLPPDTTFEQFAMERRAYLQSTQWADLLQIVIDSKNVGLHISNMKWFVYTVENSNLTFLTSDHPVFMTNGLVHADAHIIFPIGPTKVFVAVNNVKTERAIRTIPPSEFLNSVNAIVVGQAKRLVFGVDDRQLRFVEDHFRSPGWVSNPF